MYRLTNSELKEMILNKGVALGFGIICVIKAQSFDLWDRAISERKIMDPATADSWEKRGLSSSVKSIMPEAKTIIAAVYPYTPFKGVYPEGIAEFSAHYRYYPKGRNSMGQLADILIRHNYKAMVDPPFPMKAIAHRSGLGYFGKNGLIHNEVYGSFMTLHGILTDAVFPYDDTDINMPVTDCHSCNLCIKACPTGAIAENGVVILSKCLRHHMLSSDIIPVDIRESIGKRMIGCESCQVSCPKNIRLTDKDDSLSKDDFNLFDIAAILKDYKKGLKPRMKAMGSLVGNNYARPQKILSMAVIAAGNTKDPSYLPLLKETLSHSHPPIRAHAAWAIGRIGGSDAKEILKSASNIEIHFQVLNEIMEAFNKC